MAAGEIELGENRFLLDFYRFWGDFYRFCLGIIDFGEELKRGRNWPLNSFHKDFLYRS